MYFNALSDVVVQQWSLPRYWGSSSTTTTSNQILPEGWSADVARGHFPSSFHVTFFCLLSKAFWITLQWKLKQYFWICRMWVSSIMKIKLHPRLSQRPVNGWVSPSIGGLPDDVSSMLGVGGHGKMAEGWFLEYTSPLAPACFGPLMQLRQRRRPTKISQLIPYCSRTWQNMVAGLFWPSLEGALALKRADPTVYWLTSTCTDADSLQACSFIFSDLYLAKLQFYKRFYIYFRHNMFRRLAPCSRGGFGMTDKTFQ